MAVRGVRRELADLVQLGGLLARVGYGLAPTAGLHPYLELMLGLGSFADGHAECSLLAVDAEDVAEIGVVPLVERVQQSDVGRIEVLIGSYQLSSSVSPIYNSVPRMRSIRFCNAISCFGAESSLL